MELKQIPSEKMKTIFTGIESRRNELLTSAPGVIAANILRDIHPHLPDYPRAIRDASRAMLENGADYRKTWAKILTTHPKEAISYTVNYGDAIMLLNAVVKNEISPDSLKVGTINSRAINTLDIPILQKISQAVEVLINHFSKLRFLQGLHAVGQLKGAD